MENIYSTITEKYNMSFLEKLKTINNIHVYAFGGIIRDIYLERVWKEVDLRITLDQERETRESIIEGALSEYDLQGKTQVEHLHLTVYRFLPKGSNTSEPIDLSLIPTLDYNLPDFTINSLFYDVINLEIVDRYNGISDLENKLIRTVNNPTTRFSDEPHMIFRAIKFACQLGFDIENETKKAITECSHFVQNTFSFISETKEGIFVELFLGNIFKGLQSDPVKYFSYMQNLKLFDEFVNYTSKTQDIPVKTIMYPTENQGSFEENISYFFSCLARSLDTDKPEEVFNVLVHNLAIVTSKQYSDFVINSDLIRYS
jgi:tRNA nucleotidyltransferase (CCA-adding enzyme)